LHYFRNERLGIRFEDDATSPPLRFFHNLGDEIGGSARTEQNALNLSVFKRIGELV
jgi:hypothetical protein